MTRKKFTKKIFNLTFALALPVISFGTLGLASNLKTDASVTNFYTNFQSITNSSFNGISTTYASNGFDGWSLIGGNTKATTMIIDVNKNYSQNSASPYCISTLSNPGKVDTDDKILMINSANRDNNPSSSNYTAKNVKEGYKSSNITLKENSYYILQASYKTDIFPSAELAGADAFASIYLDGLTDGNGNEVSLSYEMLSSSSWETVYFFITTPSEEQIVNLQLWLGSKTNASFGVAFFDAIYLQRCSSNIFYYNYNTTYYNANNFYFNTEKTNTDSNGNTYNYYGENTSYNDDSKTNVQLCELEKDNQLFTDINLDFEKDNSSSLNSFVDWAIESQSEYGHSKVIDITAKSVFTSTTGYSTYPASNYRHNNSKALALWTTVGQTGYSVVKSQNIEIKAHECYKISALVKVSDLTNGTFVLTVKENDTIFTSFAELSGHYTLNSTTTSISANGSDNFVNEYAEATIYVQGHDLYDTSVNILLSIGSENSQAQGCVVVDDVKVEKASYDAYSNANTKLKFNTITTEQDSLNIANGYFNSAYNTKTNVAYPLTATSWTKAQDTNSTVYSGVINLYDEYFEELKSNYDWAAGLANPAKDRYVSNNVYMMYNPTASYQSITSQAISISKANYYVLTIDFKTIKTANDKNADLSIKIYDDDLLVYDDLVATSGNWSTYKAYVFTGEQNGSLKLTLSFGTEDAKSQGYLFVEKVKFEETTEGLFTSAIKKADLSNLMLNLDPTNAVTNSITTAYAFTESGTNGEAGVIKGKDNDTFGYRYGDSIDDGSLENNVLVIATNSVSTYKLSSKVTLSLESGKYYKLTFRLLTSLPDANEDEDLVYGAKVGLTNFENTDLLLSNEGWKTYTIYFYNEDSTSISSNLEFSLTSTDYTNTGYAYLTDLVWTEDDSDETLKTEFENASSNDEFGSTIFTKTYEATAENEEETENETQTEDETQNPSANTLAILLYVSSGITGLAIIIAVIGYTLRKIKIKKVEKTKTADYDRKIVLSQKAITMEAERIKREEEKELEAKIEIVKGEIEELEKHQKSNINASRQNNGKITKEIEREFKSYAGKRTKLQDRLNMFNEQLSNVQSPEYMISLEKKVSAQMMRERKNAQKRAKNDSKK